MIQLFVSVFFFLILHFLSKFGLDSFTRLCFFLFFDAVLIGCLPTLSGNFCFGRWVSSLLLDGSIRLLVVCLFFIYLFLLLFSFCISCMGPFILWWFRTYVLFYVVSWRHMRCLLLLLLSGSTSHRCGRVFVFMLCLFCSQIMVLLTNFSFYLPSVLLLLLINSIAVYHCRGITVV